MKLTLLIFAGLIAVSSAFPSLGGWASALTEHVTEEPPVTLPPGYMSWAVSPKAVRVATLAAVTAAGIPPPVNAWIATAAANRAIEAMNLEATIVTTTSKPGMMGNMVNAVQGSAKQTAATTAGRATEMAVSGALSGVVGDTVGSWVGRQVGNQVVKTLGGTVAEQKKADDDEHKQSWAQWAKSG